MQYEKDTIVAIATASSGIGGGIAIIRISGANALYIAQQIAKPAIKSANSANANTATKNSTNLSKSTSNANNKINENDTNSAKSTTNTSNANNAKSTKESSLDFAPRYATLCNIYDKDEILLDEAIIIYYKAPHSYTCEDIIEVQCHASDIIAQKVLDSCLHYGARLARGGEFTNRAFVNGRIDLSQANAISQMIATKDAFLQTALISQLKGSLGDFVREVREVLLLAIASAELMIDYREEDIASDFIEDLKINLKSLQTRLSKIYDFSTTRAKIGNAWKLAIIGKPNVGKSSLLNAILLEERAITSNIAGTTRDRIEEEILIDGSIIRLIDTAGIRASNDAIESKGIERSLQAIREANIILAVFDSSNALNSEDKEVLEILSENNKDKKILAILNKSDCKNALSSANVEHIKSICKDMLNISALKVEQTARIMHDKLKEIINQSNLKGEIILSAPYQLESIKSSIAHLDLALGRLKEGELELFAYHIKDTLESIGQITSPYTNEEMLDKMFSEFCLGK